jgi:hypothetical protein
LDQIVIALATINRSSNELQSDVVFARKGRFQNFLPIEQDSCWRFGQAVLGNLEEFFGRRGTGLFVPMNWDAIKAQRMPPEALLSSLLPFPKIQQNCTDSLPHP